MPWSYCVFSVLYTVDGKAREGDSQNRRAPDELGSSAPAEGSRVCKVLCCNSVTHTIPGLQVLVCGRPTPVPQFDRRVPKPPACTETARTVMRTRYTTRDSKHNTARTVVTNTYERLDTQYINYKGYYKLQTETSVMNEILPRPHRHMGITIERTLQRCSLHMLSPWDSVHCTQNTM